MGGEWVIKSVKSPVTMEIYDGKHSKVVHINRLQHRSVPGRWDNSQCLPPLADHHVILPPAEQTVPGRYPQRQRRPPDWYRP